jgi:kynurenine formamidase
VIWYFLSTGVLIDVSDNVEGNDFELEPEHIMTWESKHGPIPYGSVVLVRFGWSSLHYDNRTAYFGYGTSNTSELNFPGKSKSVL